VAHEICGSIVIGIRISVAPQHQQEFGVTCSRLHVLLQAAAVLLHRWSECRLTGHLVSCLPYEIIILCWTLWLRDGSLSTPLELVLAPVAQDSDLQQWRLLLDQRRRWGVLGPFLNAEGYKLVLVIFEIYCILRGRKHFVNLVQNIDLQYPLSVLNSRLWRFRFAFMTCVACCKMCRRS
jgi:hypothetical protein